MFRIVAGLLILGDVIARSTRFSYFYSEDGVVPRSLAQALAPDNAFSLLFFSTSETFTFAVFALHAVVAIQLIAGYRTRLATIVSFLLVISLDNRNTAILSYADALFRLLLFWGIFLPLGERWSVDAVHRQRPARAAVTSLASAAILIQMFYMYFGNGLQKFAGETWMSGEATPFIFGLDDITWFLAPYLTAFPEMLKIGGWTWFFMLVFLSWFLVLAEGRVRIAIVAMFMIAHLSFALTVRIGAFPYVAMAGLILFLQAPFWNDLSRVIGFFSRRVTGVTSLARRIQAALVAGAQRLPRPVASWELPERLVTPGTRGLVILAMVAILVLPPLAFLDDLRADERHVRRVERPVTEVTSMFAIDQPPWTIFAPSPQDSTRYFVFPARTQDGEILDIFHGRELTFDRPYDPLRSQYMHYRERFYMSLVSRHEEGDLVLPMLAGYLCERWEHEHGISLREIDIYLIRELIDMETISDHADRERTSELLARHSCDGDDPAAVASPEF